MDNDNQKLSNFEDEKLNAGNEYTFDDLQSKIDAAYAGGELNFDAGDLYVNTNSKAITISQTLTINGNGATISGATSFSVTGGNVVLKNVKFFKSRVMWSGVNGTLDNCSFVNNSVTYNAGSVYWSGANGTLSNCSFVNNTVKSTGTSGTGGGAVYWNGANGTLSNCSFVNNTVKLTTNAGGAVYWNGANGVLGNCSFVNMVF